MSFVGSNNSKNSVKSQLEYDILRDVAYKRTASQKLRGAKVPISRLSPAAQKSLTKLRKIVEKRLSKLRPSSFGQSVRTPFYQATANIDKETWVLGPKRNQDAADISTHPSYNILNFQYDLNCYVRYLEAKEKYDNQLKFELESYINSKRTVCEQYFTRSFFSYTTLWPPLHTKAEIDYFYRNFFQLTSKQKKRLNYLMKTNISLGR
ncbi:uncharacterized protein Dwil_GK28097 [Drosophila willistoni]|uniref:Uncharacterized protein n=2 Tax=Drosophila willistoni TaxID=7260 RepID=A0A0Q9X579_DROWI|nr:uncharacterized protein Dwil_GK28097 [Drosophila willistoni]